MPGIVSIPPGNAECMYLYHYNYPRLLQLKALLLFMAKRKALQVRKQQLLIVMWSTVAAISDGPFLVIFFQKDFN